MVFSYNRPLLAEFWPSLAFLSKASVPGHIAAATRYKRF